MYEWEKEQTAKSNTINILLLCFLKHKIAMDSAAWGKGYFWNSVSMRGYFAVEDGIFQLRFYKQQ